MKRYTRISPEGACLVPKKALAWIMLATALLTILSFLAMEACGIARQGDPESTAGDPFEPPPAASARAPPWDTPSCPGRPFLLTLVASAPENFGRRDAIRQSWARDSLPDSEVVFLVGRSANRFLNVLVRKEHEQSGDLLLGPYLDTYRNLTAKVLHGMRWALSRCRPAYLLKTDDDCFVNLPLLTEFLARANPVMAGLYAGHVRWAAPVVRDPQSRWFVSEHHHRSARYAPYVSGAGYVLSLDVLVKLVDASTDVLPFANEDAYVGAVLSAAGVRPTASFRFVTQAGPWQVCNFRYLFVVHRVKATEQRAFREMAQMAGKKCSADDVTEDWT